MSGEILVVFTVIVGALILFITERFPIDQVALTIPVVLLLLGILSPLQAVSGFSSEATVTVAAMLVLSLGLAKTGAVAAVGRWAETAPLGGPRLRLLVLCLIAAGVSPFLNNTPIVVALLPVFFGVARKAKEPASLYLMPLSFMAMLGGTITLIGTSTNLIVNGMARERGFDDLQMFSLAPLGVVYLAVGLVYMFTVGRWLLPRREAQADLSGKYEVRDFVTELEVTAESDAVGKSLAELQWGRNYGVSVLGIHRGKRKIWNPGPRFPLEAGDLMYAQGDTDRLLTLAEKAKLATPVSREADIDLGAEDARLVEVLVGPGSPLEGRTLRETRFQQTYDCTVLAIQHHGRTVRERLPQVRIQVGDLLLVHGRAPALEALVDHQGLIGLGEVEPPAPDRPRALVAVAILAGVIAAASLGGMSILAAALIGVMLMIYTRCVRLSELYAELDWSVVFLLAGVIPLGLAMDVSGAAEWLGHAIAETLGPFGPTVTIAAFYVVTSLMTETMSNNASAAVLTPIAILTAQDLGMNPYALLVAVMFGASASFMTPMGYQTNAIILGPGGYRFTDFVRVGGPLNLLLLVTAALLIPVFWPS